MEHALRSLLDWYEQVGIEIPPVKAMAIKKRPIKKTSVKTTTARSDTAYDTAPNDDTRAGPNPDTAQRIKAAQQAAKSCHDLESLHTALQQFDAGPLSDLARQAIFSCGNPLAKLMIIGDRPSRDDDQAASPLSGIDGTLLTNMLAAIGIDPEHYYLTMAINWYGGKASSMTQSDIDICRPFLQRHIHLVNPDHIILLGDLALKSFSIDGRIMKNNGLWHSLSIENRPYQALALYPPTLLRQQPALKKAAWRSLLSLHDAIKS